MTDFGLAKQLQADSGLTGTGQILGTPVHSANTGENLARSLLPYVHPYIFLFMGGMCIAAAMQQ